MAAPVKEMFPFAVETVEAPPSTLIPCEAPLLGPPVPLRAIIPLPNVLIPPEALVREIPWQAPLVPRALAVIAIEAALNVVSKKKPTPPLP